MTATVPMSSIDYLTLRLRARRVALGLSQRDLAELLGTVQSAVSAWEAGTPGIQLNSLERWCEALGLRLHCQVHDWGREL